LGRGWEEKKIKKRKHMIFSHYFLPPFICLIGLKYYLLSIYMEFVGNRNKKPKQLNC